MSINDKQKTGHFDDFARWNNCIPNAYKKEKKNDIANRNADLKKEEKEIEIKDQILPTTNRVSVESRRCAGSNFTNALSPRTIGALKRAQDF